MDKIKQIIQAHVEVGQRMLQDEQLLKNLQQVVEGCAENFRRGGKLLLCGNGGSAADAQHLAAEFSGRFYRDRDPLFAEALHVNTSYLTAVANDYHYDEVYARLLRAMGRPGDWLFAFSTSGNSANVVSAAATARDQEMTVVGFTGESGGKLREWCDYHFPVPSEDTPRIQEAHILLGHIICQGVEEELFNKERK